MSRYSSLRLAVSLAGAAFASSAAANTVLPTGYDMRGGDSSTYRYYDETYTGGTGPQTYDGQMLSGGHGVLTDGIVADQNWFEAEAGDGYHPYVGWHSVDPTITFHFAGPVHIDGVTIYVDDSGGAGGVHPPSEAQIHMGSTFIDRPIPDPGSPKPFGYTFAGLNLHGSSLDLTLDRLPGGEPGLPNWVFLSEVQFSGTASPVPVPQAVFGGAVLLAGMAVVRRLRRVRRVH